MGVRRSNRRFGHCVVCLTDCRERLFGPAANRFDIAKRFICDDRTGDMEANRMDFP